MHARDIPKEFPMKSFVFALATVSAFAVPLTAFSQSDATPTRAQVRAELQQFEQAGYRPAGEEPNYPVNEQAAETRVSAENGAAGYGGATSGSSVSGSRSDVQPASAEQLHQLYMGGQ
jgi:hypothetical protein